MPASLKDVARLARCSPITVSRALSGTHVVAPATKRRVMAAVKSLHYVPDLLARGLVRQRSSTLGLLVPELANPFFIALVDAVQSAVRARDHMLVVSQSARLPQIEAASLKQFQQLRVGGVLIVPVSAQPPLHDLTEGGTPVVVLGRRSTRHDSAAVDDLLGGRLAAQHLLSLGHRRIGCVYPLQPHNVGLQDRLTSFTATLREAGIKPIEPIVTKGVHMEDGVEAAERFLALGSRRPGALFLTADHLAIGFLQTVRRHGLAVPQDVAIVGYDDVVYARYLDVPLTTIALPIPELARRAVDLLFARIEQPEGKRQHVLLETTLVVRGSSG